MTRLTATCGHSTLKTGTTRLNLGMVKLDGTLIIREMHRTFPTVSDIKRGEVPASTAGSNSGVLGSWVHRDIDVPDDTVMFLTWSIKSSSMPLAKMLTFGLRFREDFPYMEMLFPAVTDRHSTLHELPLSGRFNLMSVDELREDARRMKGLSISHNNAVSTLESLSEEGVLLYWKQLCTPLNSEGKCFINVAGNASFEEYPVMLKYVLPPAKATDKPARGKQVKTQTGRKVLISGRKRKIKLS